MSQIVTQVWELMLGRRRCGRRGTRPRKLAIDGLHRLLSQLRRVPLIVIEQRRQILLGLFEGFALLDAPLHLARKPLEELTELAEFFLAGGRAVARHVSANVPTPGVAPGVDPEAAVFISPARSAVSEKVRLKKGARKCGPLRAGVGRG